MVETLKDVLGQSQKVKSFLDKKERLLTPVKMKNFPEFIEAFSQINRNEMWANYLFPESQESIKKLIQMSFPNEDIDVIQDNITAGNFNAIMDLIMQVNGIELVKDEKNVQREE